MAAFLPAVDNDFVGYDDPEYVTANPHVQRGLSWETIGWAFSSTEVAAWHPLSWFSHALDCQLFGLQPWGHHLTAIVLHAVNAVLCFLVLRRLTGAKGRSWAVAAIFALHPLRVESVAWVSERKDVLSLAFFFLTLLSYTSYLRFLLVFFLLLFLDLLVKFRGTGRGREGNVPVRLGSWCQYTRVSAWNSAGAFLGTSLVKAL
jgi:hypothetical protein